MIVTYSQCGEDKYVLEKYFSNVQNGTFIELGAMDGVRYSNTKMFEDSFGWYGVLIEPHPAMFESLQKNRPNSKCYNYAVSTEIGSTIMLVSNELAVSTIESTVGDDFKRAYHTSSSRVSVPTMRLCDILKDANVTKIDFFSLDVEGHEYEVLQTMDWSIPVHVFLVETLGISDDEPVRRLLSENGYIFDGKCAHNELWVNSNWKSD